MLGRLLDTIRGFSTSTASHLSSQASQFSRFCKGIKVKFPISPHTTIKKCAEETFKEISKSVASAKEFIAKKLTIEREEKVKEPPNLEGTKTFEPQSPKDISKTASKVNEKGAESFDRHDLQPNNLNRFIQLVEPLVRFLFEPQRRPKHTPDEVATSPKNYEVITEDLSAIINNGEVLNYGSQRIERPAVVLSEITRQTNQLKIIENKKNEVITQISDLRTKIKDLQNKIDEFLEQNPLYGSSQEDIEILNLESQITSKKKELETLENSSKKTGKILYDLGVIVAKSDWIGSNDFRDSIKENGFTKAAEQYVPMPVNFRWQSWNDDKTSIPSHKSSHQTENVELKSNIGFFRLGVITDLRNGFTNLNELKILYDMSDHERKEALAKKVADLQKMLGKLDPDKAKNKNKIQALKAAIDQFESANDKQVLNLIIKNRRAALQGQFAHLLNQQIQKNGITDPGQAFHMAHIALLNEKKVKLEETGWMHNESNELQDMLSIFQDYDGKEIVFGDNFFIDDFGGIHLERPASIGGEIQSFILRTHFININLQGGLISGPKSGKVQDAVLKQAIEKLMPIIGKAPVEIQERFKDINNRMNQEESNHRLAEDIALLMHDLGVPFSVGCLSAKDRTKIVAENVIRRFAIATIDGKIDTILSPELSLEDLKTKKASAAQIMNAVWTDPENASSQVLMDTTKKPVAKFSSFWIKDPDNYITWAAKKAFLKEAIWSHKIEPLLTGKNSDD